MYTEGLVQTYAVFVIATSFSLSSYNACLIDAVIHVLLVSSTYLLLC